MARTLRVEIIGDISSYERSLKTAGAQTQSFGATIGKTLGKAAAFTGIAVGADALLHFGIEAVKTAGQVQKSTEAIQANFGDAADSVLKFAEGAAKIGLSAGEAQKVATQFGLLFKNIGIAKGPAAQMTIGFEKLGAAISQIKGTDPAGVMNKLALAAAGNTRGLKQMGIVADAATIKQEALKLGLIKTLNEGLTPGIKAQAIYAIATKNLGEFQAQAAAHAGDFANKQRVLSAEFENAKEKLGAALLPAITQLVTILADNLPAAIRTTQAVIEALGPVIELWKGMMLAMVTPIRVIIDLLHGDWTKAWDDAKAPVLAAVTFIQGLWERFAAEWSRIWDGIKQVFATAIDWINATARAGFDAILNVIRGALQLIVGAVETAWNTIKSATSAVFNAIAGIIRAAIAAAVSAATAFGEAIRTAIVTAVQEIANTVRAILSGVISAIVGLAKSAYEKALALGSAIYDGIKAGLGPIVGFLEHVLSLINAITGATYQSGHGDPPIQITPNSSGVRAAGGPVRRGGMYLVGERGPEMFVPHASGQIVPNGAGMASLGSGGGSTFIFNLPSYMGSHSEVVEALRTEFLRLQSRTGTLGFT